MSSEQHTQTDSTGQALQALGRSLRSLSRAAGRRIRQPRCVQDSNATSRPDYRVGIQKESCALNPVKLATALQKTGVKQQFQAHLYPLLAQTRHSSPEEIFFEQAAPLAYTPASGSKQAARASPGLAPLALYHCANGG